MSSHFKSAMLALGCVVLIAACSDSAAVSIVDCAIANGGCDPNAACTGAPGEVVCTCAAGFAGDGKTCSDGDECAVDNGGCDANATCTNSPGGFSCVCNDGYRGDGLACSELADCTIGHGGCDANAACSGERGAVTCVCDDGYAGDGFSCADLDECATGAASCDANATCGNTVGGFTCTCNDGYDGDGTACADIDECATGAAGCDANATCANMAGGFSCTCNGGYEGDGALCADIDECATGAAGCDANATCTNMAGGASCACLGGYDGDGQLCTDIDECATGVAGCDANATCSNTPGGHACTCNEGFLGDGTSCSDLDECVTGAAGCDPNAACANTIGGATCTCNDGFEGDGHVCTDLDECVLGTAGCGANATCFNTPGDFYCACDEGYEGDGVDCSDLDECATGAAACDPNASCANTIGGFTCTCNPRYDGDGHICEFVGPYRDIPQQPVDPAEVNHQDLVPVLEFTCLANAVSDSLTVANLEGAANEALIIRPNGAPCQFDLLHRTDTTETLLSDAPGGYLLAVALRSPSGVRVACASDVDHRATADSGQRHIEAVPIRCWAGTDSFTASVVAVAPDSAWAAWPRELKVHPTLSGVWVLTWARDFSFQFFNMSDQGRPATDGVYETLLTWDGATLSAGATNQLSATSNPFEGGEMVDWVPTEAEVAALGDLLPSGEGTCLDGCVVDDGLVSCIDWTQNGSETDVDCGGLGCLPCADGQFCVEASDCTSLSCVGGFCEAATCTDAHRDGAETGVDCGGPECAPCEEGEGCRGPLDCVDGCCVAGLCVTPTCSDGIQNGGESDVDCGGPCPRCDDELRCDVASDCASGLCTNALCAPNGCPPGFVLVPPWPTQTLQSTCVAQFEMKDVAGAAVSQAADAPWADLGRDEAAAACAAMGDGFHLITNKEWMAVGRNIESTPANWSGRSVGAGMINTGHSDGAPDQALGIDDPTDPWDQTGNNAQEGAGSGAEQKRTHVLSNGQVIWDFAGNVYEHVATAVIIPGHISSLGAGGDVNAVVEYNAPLVTDVEVRATFAPSNTSFSSAEGMGNLWGYHTYGTLWRGGSWNGDIGSAGNTCGGGWTGVGCVGAPAGIFAAAPGPSFGSGIFGYPALGFRCAK